MAALSGGGADKVGNRYEAKWGVFVLLGLVKEDFDLVRIEKPGETWAEFSTEKNGYTTWYQVKLKGATVAGTIAGIQSVLEDFGPKLHEGDVCKYVSSEGCGEVYELASRASISDDFHQFDTEFLKATGKRKDFERLGRMWRSSSEDDTFKRLQKLQVVTQDELSLESHNKLLAATLLQGDAIGVTQTLFSIYFDYVHQVISRAKLLLLLAAAGFQPLEEPSPKPRWRSEARISAQQIVEQLVLIGKFATLEPEFAGGDSDWEVLAKNVSFPLADYSDSIAETHSLCDALDLGDESSCRAGVIRVLTEVGKLVDTISEYVWRRHERWDDACTRVDVLTHEEERKEPKCEAEGRVKESEEYRRMQKVGVDRDFWIRQHDLVFAILTKDLPQLKTAISVRDI